MNLQNFNLSKVRWAQRTLAGFDETVTITKVGITKDCRVIIESKPVEKGKTPWAETNIIIMKQVLGTDDFFASEIDLSAPHAKTPSELFSRESTLSIQRRALATAFHTWELRRGAIGDIIGFVIYARDVGGCRKERSDIVFVRMPWELPMGAEHMIARYSADDNSSCDAHKAGSSEQRPKKFEWIKEAYMDYIKAQPKDIPPVGEVNVSILDDLRKERDRFSEINDELEAEIQFLEGENKVLKGEVKLLNKEKNTLKETIATLGRENDNLIAVNKSLDTKNSDLKLQSDKLNETIDTLKGHIAKKPDRFKKLRKILAVLKAQE